MMQGTAVSFEAQLRKSGTSMFASQGEYPMQLYARVIARWRFQLRLAMLANQSSQVQRVSPALVMKAEQSTLPLSLMTLAVEKIPLLIFFGSTPFQPKAASRGHPWQPAWAACLVTRLDKVMRAVLPVQVAATHRT
jgi:hypothetical protein